MSTAMRPHNALQHRPYPHTLPTPAGGPSASASSSAGRARSSAATTTMSVSAGGAAAPNGSSRSGRPSSSSRSARSPEEAVALAKRKLKILSAPLRATSPLPSPPASRSPSPEPPSASSRSTHAEPASSSSSSSTPSSSSTNKRSIPTPPSEELEVAEPAKRLRLQVEDDAQARARKAQEEASAARRKRRSEIVWDAGRFKRLNASYRDRARTLKHSGDARTRVHPKPLPASAESLRSLVELTDSVLLWVYAFWCDDQLAPSKVNLEMWRSMDGMKKAVRDLWEGIVRSSRGGAGEESAKAMLGLCYLIDGLVMLHTLTWEQHVLSLRAQRVQASSSSSRLPPPSAPIPPYSSTRPPNGSSSTSAGGGGGSGSGGGGGGGSGTVPADSPASLADSSSSSPGSSLPFSDSHQPHQPPLPPDFLPQVVHATSSLPRAMRYFSVAQSHLSFPVLRRCFPLTWERAMTTNLVPIGGNGDDRVVDPDYVEDGWGWPLSPSGASGPAGGVGAGGQLPHLVVFGRSLLLEWIATQPDGFFEGRGYSLTEGWAK